MIAPLEKPEPLHEHVAFFKCCKSVLIAAASLLKIHVRDVHNVPMRGPLVIACNHQSYFDPVLAGFALHRPLDFMARDTLFHNPILNALISRLNTFPVKRGTADIQSVKESLRRLRQGKGLVIFPEGSRSLDGRVAPMMPGAVTLARKSGATVVPTVIDGAYEAWPRTARFPTRSPIRVAYGKPLPVEYWHDFTPDEAAAELTRIIRKAHNRLRECAGREPFDYPPEENAGPDRHRPLPSREGREEDKSAISQDQAKI